MGQMVKNKHLNYWIVGLLFTIVYPFIIGFMLLLTDSSVSFVGWMIYLIVMPYITGRIIKRVSERWLI